MENDIKMLEIAFSNLSEECKELRRQQAETNKVLSELKEKIEGFEQKITTLKVTVPTVNTVPITHTINQGIEKIKNTIEEQPKSVVRQFRILLFPEYEQQNITNLYLEEFYFGCLSFLLLPIFLP